MTLGEFFKTRKCKTDLSDVVEVVLPDGLSGQALEGHVRLGLQDDLRHSRRGRRQRGLTGSVDRVDVSSSLQQGHDDGVQGQEVGHDLLVGDDDVERSVLGSVHGLRICSSLEQQLCSGGTGELTHLVGVKVICNETYMRFLLGSVF